MDAITVTAVCSLLMVVMGMINMSKGRSNILLKPLSAPTLKGFFFV
ncbi:hypothetical protein IE5_05450 [Bacillus cereus BAG3X2-2]|nr:hypothetical protein [Bacillus cereus]EJQ15522.1 hypothetical protein IE5_05450 [Bacillus cereus BAG3X2-2]